MFCDTYAVKLLLSADYVFHSLDFNTVSNGKERGVENNTVNGEKWLKRCRAEGTEQRTEHSHEYICACAFSKQTTMCEKRSEKVILSERASVHQLPTVSLFVSRCQMWGCVGAGCLLLKKTHWFPGNRQKKMVQPSFSFPFLLNRAVTVLFCCSAPARLFVDVTAD